MGRHHHAVNVRADGLAAVLGPLLRDRAVRAATLVDIDSGMVLDACVGGGAADGPPGDLELLGAGHAELVRIALWLLGPGECEVVIDAGGRRHHVARVVPDPYGDRLALAVVVDGPPRTAKRMMRRLRQVSQAALTAGPSAARRPAMGGWPLPPTEQRIVLPAPRPRPVGGPGHPLRAQGLPLPATQGAANPPNSLFTPVTAPRTGPPGTFSLGRIAAEAARPAAAIPGPAQGGVPGGVSDRVPASGANGAVPRGGAAAPPGRARGGRPPAPPSALPPAPRAGRSGTTRVSGMSDGMDAAGKPVEPRH